MLTTISKVLAVLTTVFCLAFLGVAGVVALGGPNWRGIARDIEDTHGYQFTYQSGENPAWSAKDLNDGQSVGAPTPVLPPKIRDALTDQIQEQTTEIADLQPKIEQLKGFIATTRQGILTDTAALDSYAAGLRQQLAELGEQIERTQEERSRLTLSAEQKLQEAERLRHDYYRLENLVAAAGADHFRAAEQQKKLRDADERYQGIIDRLERRRDQLRQRLGTPGTPDLPANATTSARAISNLDMATR